LYFLSVFLFHVFGFDVLVCFFGVLCFLFSCFFVRLFCCVFCSRFIIIIFCVLLYIYIFFFCIYIIFCLLLPPLRSCSAGGDGGEALGLAQHQAAAVLREHRQVRGLRRPPRPLPLARSLVCFTPSFLLLGFLFVFLRFFFFYYYLCLFASVSFFACF